MSKNYTVAWFGEPIGHISGSNEFTYRKSWLDQNQCLSHEKISPGGTPKFLDGLLSEQDLYAHYKSKECTNPALREPLNFSSERYLANISIVKNEERLRNIPLDFIEGKLSDFSSSAGIFNGKIVNIPGLSSQENPDGADKGFGNAMPKIGGIQVKALCNLDKDGNLRSAADLPFTHIVKLSGGTSRDPDSIFASVEWASMSMAKGGGVNTCEFSLLETPGRPPVFICERFDIPKNGNDKARIFVEDLMTVYSNNPPFRANATRDDKNNLVPQPNALASLVSGYLDNATESKQDQEQLFKRIYANYLLENGDFHLKNVSLIREKSSQSKDFESTRLAPAYDIMNTRCFNASDKSENTRQKMLLDYKGKHCDFLVHDFIEIARSLDIDPARSLVLMNETSFGIAKTGRSLLENIPQSIQNQQSGKPLVEDVINRAIKFSDQAQLEIKQHKQNSAVMGNLFGTQMHGAKPAKSNGVELL